jgi:hypothetical protein
VARDGSPHHLNYFILFYSVDIVSKLIDEKSKRDQEVDALKKKVSALCSKIFLLELEREDPKANAPQGEKSLEKSLVELSEEASKTNGNEVQSYTAPIRTLTRLIILLLKDEKSKEIRPYPVTFEIVLEIRV